MLDCTLAAVPVLPVTLIGIPNSDPRFILLPTPPTMLLLELTAEVRVPILLDCVTPVGLVFGPVVAVRPG
jgi:hypothetical protein